MDGHGDFGVRPVRRGPSVGMVIFLAVVFGALSGFLGTLLAMWAGQQGRLAFLSASPTAAPVGLPAVAHGSSGGTFAQVANQLDESVVNINTLSREENPYSFFFGGGDQVVQGLGTGIIVDANGYILTNFHVVGKAQNIKVTVMHAGGKREYKAEFVGGDQQNDLAVIKINAHGLKPVRFGDSDQLQPGEPVMAIGNPFGFEHTVSVGVVSALNRSLPVDESVTLRNMIQTDASINPGNSGGPLVNAQGEIVGINSAVYVGQGGGNQPQASGIGFAIPSNHARQIMEILRKRGKVPHPFIGISYSAITDQMRSNLHLPVRQGVLVNQVLGDGPAGKAGLLRGDVIVAIDRKAIDDQAMLGDYINKLNVGKQVTLEIRRWNDGAGEWVKKDLRVKIGNKPANYEQQMRPQEQQSPAPMTPSPDQGQGQGRELPFPWPF